MKNITIYHNPRCSKSRQALQILEEQGIKPTIVEYLKTPPTLRELHSIAEKLTENPETLFRTKETVFKELNLAETTFDVRLQAITDNPILLERPLIVTDKIAIVARPPEKLLAII